MLVGGVWRFLWAGFREWHSPRGAVNPRAGYEELVACGSDRSSSSARRIQPTYAPGIEVAGDPALIAVAPDQHHHAPIVDVLQVDGDSGAQIGTPPTKDEPPPVDGGFGRRGTT